MMKIIENVGYINSDDLMVLKTPAPPAYDVRRENQYSKTVYKRNDIEHHKNKYLFYTGGSLVLDDDTNIIVLSTKTNLSVKFEYDRYKTIYRINKDLINHTEKLYDSSQKVKIYETTLGRTGLNYDVVLIIITTERI